MYDRMQTFTREALGRIHDASMDILRSTGVAFNEPEAIDIFKAKGFTVDGKTVFFTEKDVSAALETAPSRFKITARNPDKSVFVGEDDWVFLPTYGSPFLVSRTGEQRPGTMSDYDNICRLVQTSRHIDMNGFKHVEPSDVPTRTAYLDMLFSNITLCDKPYMASTDTRQAARDSIDMASIVFGGKDRIVDMPVMVGLINPLSPLQFAEEMAGSIIEYARCRQPLVILNMIMAGTSGPVKLPGLFALMNAEILAGLVLAQLVGPGTPVIYGTTSCPTNMKTGAAAIGSPETYMINSATTQLARFYNLPCRTGGSLTDAQVPRRPSHGRRRPGALHLGAQRRQLHPPFLRHDGDLHRHLPGEVAHRRGALRHRPEDDDPPRNYRRDHRRRSHQEDRHRRHLPDGPVDGQALPDRVLRHGSLQQTGPRPLEGRRRQTHR